MRMFGLGAENPRIKPSDLGSGLANKAATKLEGRALQLKTQECNAYGMDINGEGKCVRRSAKEPQLGA